MGKVARQVVEQAGVDLNVLIDKLIRAAGAEFSTFYYYTILRVNSIGFDGEGLKEIIEDARIEDRNHFEALTPAFTNWAERCLAISASSPISSDAPTHTCRRTRKT
jgi:ferritin-like protein